jgi:hypothetical protein
MLRIYTDKKLLDVPMIYDCDSAFEGIKLTNIDFTNRVLGEIELGEYVDEDTFKDRFGRNMYISNLSTSSKILLLASKCDNYALFCDEIGSNAVDFLLECINAIIYFEGRNIEFKTELIEPVSYNNKVYNTVHELNSAIAGGGVYIGN